MNKILFIFFSLPFIGFGQSINENYIKTTYYKKPNSQAEIDVTNPSNALVKINYFDGLGRTKQNIAYKQSPTGNDIVLHLEYDAYGRQIKEYLPIVNGQSLDFHNINNTTVGNYYNSPAFPTMETTTVPYYENYYENSPKNIVLKKSAPGNDWQMNLGHEIKYNYSTNTVVSAESVKLYNVTTEWNSSYNVYSISLVQNGFYAANELFKSTIKDENWVSGDLNTTQEYKDKEGKLILKRTFANDEFATTIPHDTYYVYDDFGNLTYVIPPLAQDINPNTLNELCYQYKYDSKNRVVEKKLPGKQWEYLVYDKLDRVVLSGPVKTPFYHLTNDGWMVTKYDDFDRIIMTGWMTSASTITSSQRKAKQDERDAQTIFSEVRLSNGITSAIPPISANNPSHNYSNLVVPTSGYYILSINYYDDYNFIDAPTNFSAVENQVVYYNNTTKPKGLLTGKWLRVLDNTTSQASSKKITSYLLYDYKGRIIRSFEKNYESSPGWTQVDSKLDFEGKTEYTVTSHRRTANDPGALTITDYYTYTNQNNLLAHTQKINSGPIQLIAENAYNDLGQLLSKKIGNTTNLPLQKIDYTYNIRGWLKGVNNDPTDSLLFNTNENDLFSYKINYNSVQNGINYIGQKNFNGNISEIYWRSKTDNTIKKYGFIYDGLNRLSNAIYLKPTSDQTEPNTFNESIKYDKNGNITNLIRNGGTDGIIPEQVIDNLTYTYANNNFSNKLLKVSDSVVNLENGFFDGTNTGNDYTYDNYGNMLTDLNKNISSTIRYNHLNLPVEIVFDNTNKISYVYDAEGRKLEKNIINGTVTTTTKYMNGFQYLNAVLQFFPTVEGYVKKTGNAYFYVFNYTDHLGNIRMSYSDNNNDGMISLNEIIDTHNYYPFGLEHSNATISEFKYKFQGQERQDELGLNWDSFKWRNYDPAIARFMSIDPLTEKYVDWSTYVFSGNRVIDARELEGLEPYVLFNNETAALRNFGQQYNGKSIKQGVEYGANVYTVEKNGKTCYAYDKPNVGDTDGVSYPTLSVDGATRVGTIHAHGEYLEGYDNNIFSPADKDNANKRGVDNNVVTPNGSLLKFDVETDKVIPIATDMPSDPKDPDRKNKVAPNDNPAPVKTKPIEPKKKEQPGSAGPANPVPPIYTNTGNFRVYP